MRRIHSRSGRSAFTLIELLIVVAIIAILALIAVPNFLEAQTRSKIARCRNDMRVVSIALESYFIDWDGYPQHKDFPSWPIPRNFRPWFAALTTPVSYLTTMPQDPFMAPTIRGAVVPAGNTFHYDPLQNSWGIYGDQPPYDWMPSWWGPYPGFVDKMVKRGFWYVIWSPGPDGVHQFHDNRYGAGAFYDPTNGTVSSGDLARLGPGGSDFITLN